MYAWRLRKRRASSLWERPARSRASANNRARAAYSGRWEIFAGKPPGGWKPGLLSFGVDSLWFVRHFDNNLLIEVGRTASVEPMLG
jgi:hypothetical protein